MYYASAHFEKGIGYDETFLEPLGGSSCLMLFKLLESDILSVGFIYQWCWRKHI